jgi:mRNA interferase HigB
MAALKGSLTRRDTLADYNAVLYLAAVRIIASTRLRAMAAPWPQARQEVEAWLGRVRVVIWNTAADVRQTDPRASMVGNRRVVFDFCNNDLRLIVKIDYHEHQVFIRWFGTHRDYDRINAEEA